jgi:hypothetical protein
MARDLPRPLICGAQMEEESIDEVPEALVHTLPDDFSISMSSPQPDLIREDRFLRSADESTGLASASKREALERTGTEDK